VTYSIVARQALAGTFVLAFLLLGSCKENSSKPVVSTLSIAVLPDDSSENLLARYTPLIDHISAFTGYKVNLVIPDSYQHLLELFGKKQIDMARFGGFTYIKANRDYGAKALVFRDIDAQFTSVILVRAESKAKTLGDLKGLRFGFGSELSTSGHLMPRQFLMDDKINPETYFSSVVYTGSHNKTAESVRDRKVDAGVANSDIIEQMFRTGQLKTSEVRILWRSPTYQDYLWAVNQDMDQQTARKIRDSFLVLPDGGNAEKVLLKRLGANYFLPATEADFVSLAEAVDTYEKWKNQHD